MRDIKFRGKRVDNGEWVYGYYGVDFDNAECIYTGRIKADDDTGCNCWNVLPSSVGQFTGLKDREGVEVFEGDIIKYVNERKPEVISYGDIEETHGVYDGLDEYTYNYIGFVNADLTYSKIIGNTTDNPELLT